MDSHMFDGLIGGLLIMGALAGLVIGGVVFVAIPWVWSHFSIIIH